MVKNDSFSSQEIEITSVGTFIQEIKKLKENSDGESTDFYFRGQEVDFWDIQPSIFRDDMLSVEDKLMRIPLQNNPFDFKDLDDTFDIMTKYQHYGMCTRLLDLTTNPLVALYFACKLHSDKNYLKHEESTGVVYFAKYYPTYQTDLNVKIISFLASCNLSKSNKIKDVLDSLENNRIITNEVKEKWMKKENIKKFIDILQKNYLVIPTYSNQRLRRQSGVFLLVSAFTVDIVDTLETGIINKTKKNLREEFDPCCFTIPGEYKKEIIKELDMLGINEATLFPELEHQLSYIKFIHQEQPKSISDFYQYEENHNKVISFDNVNEKELNKEFISKLENLLINKTSKENLDEIIKLLNDCLIVDWYKREPTRSKIKRNLIKYSKSHEDSLNKEAVNILVNESMMIMNELIKKHMLKKKDGD